VEDVAIAYGFNDFAPEIPRLPTMGRPKPEEEFGLKLKHLMVGLGFQEMLNLSLSSRERQFAMMGITDPGAIEIENPVSSEYSLCRFWVLPSLMENLSSNIHRRYPQRIFELADCIRPDPKADTRARNTKRLAAAVSHAGAGFSEIMSLFRAFTSALPLELSVSECKHSSFIPGRCASIKLKKREIGHLGEINPAALNKFGLKMPVAAFELDTEALWKQLKK
jgi:phenylalanyl-tRNA synthetase beta chain